ncbi:MAG: GNAT family N-acetyltransferase [Ruminococcus sp.]|nr:GNAT family N-acetyltransferase [Ruminococcus sp.]
MTVRYLTDGDDPAAVSEIYERSWKHAYKGIIPQAFLDGIPRGKWAKHLKNASMRHFVAEENGVLIGTASVCASRWEDFKGYGELVSIYFLPEYTGKGHGSKLLERCIAELGSMGFERVMLWVLEDNLSARAFYERRGFICTETFLADEIGGKPLREAAYVRGIGGV